MNPYMAMDGVQKNAKRSAPDEDTPQPKRVRFDDVTVKGGDGAPKVVQDVTSNEYKVANPPPPVKGKQKAKLLQATSAATWKIQLRQKEEALNQLTEVADGLRSKLAESQSEVGLLAHRLAVAENNAGPTEQSVVELLVTEKATLRSEKATFEFEKKASAAENAKRVAELTHQLQLKCHQVEFAEFAANEAKAAVASKARNAEELVARLQRSHDAILANRNQLVAEGQAIAQERDLLKAASHSCNACPALEQTVAELKNRLAECEAQSSIIEETHRQALTHKQSQLNDVVGRLTRSDEEKFNLKNEAEKSAAAATTAARAREEELCALQQKLDTSAAAATVAAAKSEQELRVLQQKFETTSAVATAAAVKTEEELSILRQKLQNLTESAAPSAPAACAKDAKPKEPEANPPPPTSAVAATVPVVQGEKEVCFLRKTVQILTEAAVDGLSAGIAALRISPPAPSATTPAPPTPAAKPKKKSARKTKAKAKREVKRIDTPAPSRGHQLLLLLPPQWLRRLLLPPRLPPRLPSPPPPRRR